MVNQVDLLLSRIGTGKWNIFQFVVTGVASGLPVPFAIAGVFVVPRLHYTCRQPSTTHHEDIYTNDNDTNSCSYSVRTENGDFKEEACTQWDFENSTFTNTITSEFDLVCEKEYVRALYMSLYMIGVLVASPPIGYVADRYGRKSTFVTGVLAFVFLAIISGWLPNVPSLLVCRFLIGITHVPVVKISYILGMEASSPDVRSITGMMLYLPWTLSTLAFAALAYFVRDWRWLLTVSSLVSLLLLPTLWFIDESAHYLAVKGKYGRALQVLKKAARWNNVTLPPDEEIIYLLKEQHAAMGSKTKHLEEQQSWISTFKSFVMDLFILFRTPRLRIISSVMHLNFLVVGMVFYGLAFSGGNLSIDIFSYIALLGLMELPSHSVLSLVVARFGRKIPLVLGFISAGVVLLCIPIIPYDKQWLVVTFALLGRLNICVSGAINYLFGSELFPTEVRTRGITYSFMMSRVGSSIAPFITEYLGYSYRWAPSVVFGASSILAGVVSLALWETLGTVLPDTIAYLESNTNPNFNAKGIMKIKDSGGKPSETENQEAKEAEDQIQLKASS